jgi:hypothetical protein
MYTVTGILKYANFEECRLLECGAVSILCEPMFRRNISPPSSGQKNPRERKSVSRWQQSYATYVCYMYRYRHMYIYINNIRWCMNGHVCVLCTLRIRRYSKCLPDGIDMYILSYTRKRKCIGNVSGRKESRG